MKYTKHNIDNLRFIVGKTYESLMYTIKHVDHKYIVTWDKNKVKYKLNDILDYLNEGNWVAEKVLIENYIKLAEEAYRNIEVVINGLKRLNKTE